MLGTKIALTGFVFVLVSLAAIIATRREMPSLWMALPLLGAFFGGFAAVVVGTLMNIWL